MAIFKEMEMAIIKLMQQLGIITPEAGKIMASQAQGQGSLPNPNMVPGGMPPGSNPLELLQMQQRQQFQQMKKAQE